LFHGFIYFPTSLWPNNTLTSATRPKGVEMNQKFSFKTIQDVEDKTIPLGTAFHDLSEH